MLSALGSFALSFLLRFAMDAFTAWRAGEAQKAAGRAEAVSEGARVARQSAVTARQEEVAAEASHRADPTDAAFDPEFRRD